MAKIEVLDWNEFFKGNIVPINQPSKKVNTFFKATLPIFLAASPRLVYAASDSSYYKIVSEAIIIADWANIGVIMFSGGVWMFGNRTKSIEMLLGGSIGYLIIRHAMDIHEWLKLL